MAGKRWIVGLCFVLVVAAVLLWATSVFADGGIIHVVRRGDTVGNLAWQYGVSSRAIVAANRLKNPDLIYVGQRLLIPLPGGPTPRPPTPTPPTPTPGPVPCPCEAIIISSPLPDATITSPITVTGVAAGFEQTVVVTVLDGSAGEIGRAYGRIEGEFGQRGVFTATVTFTPPFNSQPGRIQVWNVSPRDGAIEHLNSVAVNVQGLDVEALVSHLAAVIAAEDYDGLESLMAPSFVVRRYRDAETAMAPAQAVALLRREYLGPAEPRIDFSVDARALLGERVSFTPEIVHVVYSQGWGPAREDDAFLLIGDVDGRARWSGLLYVPRAMIDYR